MNRNLSGRRRGKGQGWDEGQAFWVEEKCDAKGWKGSVCSGCSRPGGGLGADFLIIQGTADTVPRGHEMFRDPKTV